MVSLAMHRETVAAIQRADGAALAAAHSQVDQLRADIAAERARHDAEMARALAERDTLHLGHVERLLAQTALERALWQERAATAEHHLADLVGRIMATLPAMESAPPAGPWWRRWFGASTKSNLKD